MRRLLFAFWAASATVLLAPPASAAMPVVDVRAITQLVTQIETLREQLTTARQHLTQAQDEWRSITGSRGMERLLSGTARNYLPPDWAELEAAMRDARGQYQGLSQNIQSTIERNAVLSAAQLARLSSADREQLEATRRTAAVLGVLAREALATTSARFESIQNLIDAIPAAQDQKAILDLQARISAEQGMLTNEQTKLELLHRAAEAEARATRLRAREQAIADIGSLRRLPSMGLVP